MYSRNGAGKIIGEGPEDIVLFGAVIVGGSGQKEEDAQIVPQNLVKGVATCGSGDLVATKGHKLTIKGTSKSNRKFVKKILP